jgi:hypothetical protein
MDHHVCGDRDSLIILLTALVYSIHIPLLPGMLLEINFFLCFGLGFCLIPLPLIFGVADTHNPLSFDVDPDEKNSILIPRL